MQRRDSHGRPQRLHRGERTPAQLPVNIGAACGTTINISATGMFLVVDGNFRQGMSIDFNVDLATPTGPLVLSCQGEVVRIEDVDGRCGIGIKIIEQTLKHPQTC